MCLKGIHIFVTIFNLKLCQKYTMRYQLILKFMGTRSEEKVKDTFVLKQATIERGVVNGSAFHGFEHNGIFNNALIHINIKCH